MVVEHRLPSPCVVVLVGPSSAGKTSWAERHFQPNQIVSSDDLRAAVGIDQADQAAGTVAFELLELIVAERIRRRLTTVIDTMGFDAERRLRWAAAAAAAGVPIFAVTFNTPTTQLLERNSRRSSPLPQSVIKKQAKTHAEVVAQLPRERFDDVLSEEPVAVVAPQFASPAAAAPADPSASGHTFGLVLSRFDWGETDFEETITDIAQRAEEAGFRDLWLMDHFRQIPQLGRKWEDMPEAYTTLSFLAGRTSTIRLGALVTAATHRNPAVLGKMLATLDVLSGGRVNCGIGIGWDEAEHRGYGLTFPSLDERYAITRETVAILRLVWGKGSPSFEGEHFEARELISYPRPLQEEIPILIGGSGEKRTLRLVAELADAANLFGSVEEVAHKVQVLRRHCVEIGREAPDIEVTHLVTAVAAQNREMLGEHIDQLRGRNEAPESYAATNNAGLAENLSGLFADYHHAGATHSIVAMPNAHLEGSIEAFGQVIEAASHT